MKPMEIPQQLRDLGALLRMQDNLATALPMFIVQQRRTYQCDPDEADEVHYLDGDYEQVSDEDRKKFEQQYLESRTIPARHRRVGLKYYWEFCTACFSRKGCEDYLDRNGHNLREPRIYVETGYRNAEWEMLREFLISLPETAQDQPRNVETCPRDTDGDGNCGHPACPICGPMRPIEKK